MCGRLTQYRSWQEMHEFYTLADPPQNLAPRYNVAPTQPVGVIRAGDAGRTHTAMRWWLVPSWWKKPLKDLPAAFNAKAEGIADKPFFRSAFRHRRCIVWADGFYEWRRDGKVKTPFYITRADGAPMSFAGLWEQWTDPEDGAEVLSCTIVTCPANQAMQDLHSRMPVILETDAIDPWLAAEAGPELLVPCPDDVLGAWEVSRAVNNARHEDPDCIEPVAPECTIQPHSSLFDVTP